MKAILRRATEADAKHAASLLTELGYPSTEADARDRLVRSLRSATSYCLVAEVAARVVGLISAELVFYFPTGSTICRITSLVVSSQHRGHGLGQKLLT
ncbi:MAG: GNAT family N-acetyltransferase, partial [Pseudolabrys sp.]